jgi:hypothetical protein
MKLWEPKGKRPKVVPTHLHNHVVWSRILKCSAKSYETRPSTNCYFNEFLFTRVPHTYEIRRYQRLWAFGMAWSPGFVLGLPPKGGFRKIVQATMKHDPFTYSIGPSSVVWTKLGPALPFPPMRVLEVKWSRALSLVCEVTLRLGERKPLIHPTYKLDPYRLLPIHLKWPWLH